jgi:hypothetical protein
MKDQEILSLHEAYIGICEAKADATLSPEQKSQARDERSGSFPELRTIFKNANRGVKKSKGGKSEPNLP